MTNDLNELSVPANATGDYGVNQPENAWPGAAVDVVISMRHIGHHLFQVGWDRDSDGHEIYVRQKDVMDEDVHPWGDWQKVPPDPSP